MKEKKRKSNRQPELMFVSGISHDGLPRAGGEEVETALLSATEEIKKIKKSRFVFVSLDSRGLMRQMRLGKCHDYDFRGDIMRSPPNTI